MNIKEIKIKNFKSLYDVSFCPGNINVFIGANGSGKSSVLEAIGVLSAAMTDRVNNNSLQRKGVRLSTSSSEIVISSFDFLPAEISVAKNGSTCTPLTDALSTEYM